jgi:hypothetical protein
MVAHLPETAPRRWIGLHHDGDLDRGLNLPDLNGEPVTPSGSRLHVAGELLLPPPEGEPAGHEDHRLCHGVASAYGEPRRSGCRRATRE